MSNIKCNRLVTLNSAMCARHKRADVERLKILLITFDACSQWILNVIELVTFNFVKFRLAKALHLIII